MPFIKADAQIEGHVGRTYCHCTYAPDGSNWAAEVDALQPGETEITADEHAKILAANVQAIADAVQADQELGADDKAFMLASLATTALLTPDHAQALTASAATMAVSAQAAQKD